ncbi:Uncharacterized protein Fot_29267 [Forsythia ovata]|uniref:Uncharacterized protein n=1 Tax=Forsythia ovata TaxID=205694 RepID=A0ABD1TRF6_9LAMI
MESNAIRLSLGKVPNYSARRAGTKKMESESSTTWRKTFLVLNCILLTLDNCGGPLNIRLYFIKGGKRIWLSSCIQTVGFPITLIPLFNLYLACIAAARVPPISPRPPELPSLS